MTNGSKYAVLSEINEKKVSALKRGTDDKVRVKQLEAEISRIDKKVEQEINEIKNTPIDTALLKQQAEADYKAELSKNSLIYSRHVNEAEDNISDAERELERMKKVFEQVKAEAQMKCGKANLEAKQRLDRTMSNVGNSDRTIQLKVERVKQNGEALKSELQAKLDNLKAKTDVFDEELKLYDKCYHDIVEISKTLGDK